jgi:hypothetical protein
MTSVMAEIDDARAKVRAYLESDDVELEEFPQGWRVIEPLPDDLMGAGTLVVEQASGHLLAFSSAFPPNRVIENFDQVRPEAHVIEDGSR